MKYFCPNCGNPNEYINGCKPNFCSSCGNNFKTASVAKARQSPPYSQENHEEDSSEEYSGRENIEISKDSFQLVGDDANKFEGIPVNLIIGTATGQKNTSVQRPQRFTSTKEILEQHRNLAGSAKKPVEIQ